VAHRRLVASADMRNLDDMCSDLLGACFGGFVRRSGTTGSIKTAFRACGQRSVAKDPRCLRPSQGRRFTISAATFRPARIAAGAFRAQRRDLPAPRLQSWVHATRRCSPTGKSLWREEGPDRRTASRRSSSIAIDASFANTQLWLMTALLPIRMLQRRDGTEGARLRGVFRGAIQGGRQIHGHGIRVGPRARKYLTGPRPVVEAGAAHP
jgi:hypothetical protein